MSRNKNVDRALERARKARARLAPATARVKPLAGKAGAATARRVRRTRSWAAPQVKRAGEVLQDDVAPKVSALMSSAAERIDPDQPRRGHESGGTATGRLKRATRAAATRFRGGMRRAPAESADGSDAAGTADTDAAGRAGTDAAGTAEAVTTPIIEARPVQPASDDSPGDGAGSQISG
jgi:hypothetical protein